jgi:hypothetical protein
LASDLVLVVPEAGVDRVEWAKQLVGNAVRSPHTRQAYEYALEQFFVWGAGRAIRCPPTCLRRRYGGGPSLPPLPSMRPSRRPSRPEEQMQFLLGHVSVTTERCLGRKQRTRSAVNDRIGIEPNP